MVSQVVFVLEDRITELTLELRCLTTLQLQVSEQSALVLILLATPDADMNC